MGVVDRFVTQFVFTSDVAGLNSLDAQLSSITAKLDNLSTKFIQMGVGMAASGGGFIAAFAGIEKRQQDLVGLAGQTQEAAEDMTAAGQRLSHKYGVSISEMQDATYNLASGGIFTFKNLEAALMGAAGRLDDAGAIALTSSKILAQFRGEGLGVIDVVNGMIEAAQRGVAAPQEFATEFAKLGGLASVIGIQFSEMSGLFSFMSTQTATLAEAGTQLKAAFNELQKPGEKLKEVIEAQYGSVQNLNKAIREDGWLATVGELHRRSGLATDAFKNLFSSVEAGQGVTALMGENFAAATERIDELKDSTGAAESAFDAARQTFSWAVKQAGVAIQNFSSAIGRDVAGIFKPVIRLFSALTRALTDFLAVNPSLRQMIATFIALGTLLLPLGLLIKGVTIALSAMGPAAITTGLRSVGLGKVFGFLNKQLKILRTRTKAAVVGRAGGLRGLAGVFRTVAKTAFMSATRLLGWVGVIVYAIPKLVNFIKKIVKAREEQSIWGEIARYFIRIGKQLGGAFRRLWESFKEMGTAFGGLKRAFTVFRKANADNLVSLNFLRFGLDAIVYTIIGVVEALRWIVTATTNTFNFFTGAVIGAAKWIAQVWEGTIAMIKYQFRWVEDLMVVLRKVWNWMEEDAAKRQAANINLLGNETKETSAEMSELVDWFKKITAKGAEFTAGTEELGDELDNAKEKTSAWQQFLESLKETTEDVVEEAVNPFLQELIDINQEMAWLTKTPFKVHLELEEARRKLQEYKDDLREAIEYNMALNAPKTWKANWQGRKWRRSPYQNWLLGPDAPREEDAEMALYMESVRVGQEWEERAEELAEKATKAAEDALEERKERLRRIGQMFVDNIASVIRRDTTVLDAVRHLGESILREFGNALSSRIINRIVENAFGGVTAATSGGGFLSKLLGIGGSAAAGGGAGAGPGTLAAFMGGGGGGAAAGGAAAGGAAGAGIGGVLGTAGIIAGAGMAILGLTGVVGRKRRREARERRRNRGTPIFGDAKKNIDWGSKYGGRESMAFESALNSNKSLSAAFNALANPNSAAFKQLPYGAPSPVSMQQQPMQRTTTIDKVIIQVDGTQDTKKVVEDIYRALSEDEWENAADAFYQDMRL